ncbi:MAG: MFS transporter [Pseudomonadota bacterium]
MPATAPAIVPLSLIVSFGALFLSIFLVQLGSGALGPLDALAGSVRGFTASEIGLLGSAHFAGYLLGCFVMPALIGRVGHGRGFAAAAAVGAIGALLHPVFDTPLAWAGLRILAGFSIASAYTAVESWMQAKVENAARGRVFGTYRVVELLGQAASQGVIALLDPASYVAYNVVALFCCLCLLPLTLSRSVPPPTPKAPRLRPLKALRLAPTAAMAIATAGMTSAAYRMVGPLYGIESGLGQAEVALFLVLVVLGAAAAQVPVGWLADRLDRRHVLIALSLATVATAFWLAVAEGTGAILAGAFAFGATAWPVFSVASAYANDYAPPDFVVELNAAIILFFSLGAIASPLLAAGLIDAYGAPALFGFVMAAHLVLVAVAVYRMTQRRVPERTTPYRYLPRTSLVLSRLFKREGGHGTD